MGVCGKERGRTESEKEWRVGRVRGGEETGVEVWEGGVEGRSLLL
mgnify:CR=1 FL=1